MFEAELKRTKKALWRVAFAKMSIARAIESCNFIIVNVKTTDDPIYYPLVTAVFVLYAKPFGDNNGAGRISSKHASYDSPEKRNLHDMLMQGRNKFYAHVDVESQYYDQGDNPIGELFRLNIIVRDMKDGTDEFTTQVQELTLTLETVPRILAVCKDLLKTLCDEEKNLLRCLIKAGYKLKVGKNVMDLK